MLIQKKLDLKINEYLNKRGYEIRRQLIHGKGRGERKGECVMKVILRMPHMAQCEEMSK